jgi:hypothetical protein
MPGYCVEHELVALTSPVVRRTLEELGLQPIAFSDLQ